MLIEGTTFEKLGDHEGPLIMVRVSTTVDQGNDVFAADPSQVLSLIQQPVLVRFVAMMRRQDLDGDSLAGL